MTDLDFSNATEKDVPTIVHAVRVLRRLTVDSGMITTRTQSKILCTIPPKILILVADELAKPSSLAETLSGEKAEGR